MPLQNSGPITLADIQTEFGGSNPISLNEYYKGGAYVPSTNTNSGIPTSGQISMSQFYGGSHLVLAVGLTPGSASASSTSPGTLTTNTVTASATGNNGAVTYTYTFVSGDTFTRNGTGATASFTAGVSGASPDKDATWRVTGTDAGGNTAHLDFNVHISYVV